MDKNTTLERRFSLNATHIANPIAESTCLNINSKGSPTSFQWGGTPISPKNRSNSSICLSGNNSKSTHYNTTLASRNGTHSQLRSNIAIDPRIYADVQSKGLASRIVKYHEKGTCLTRSFSVNNLYTKPGQFPMVNLKKTELPQRAPASNISMTRIAPPEKSMFYGNTLPSVLRSNSVAAMHKSDEEISRENRPILHPPPTENEMAPTRSVLDVLKEISRKRINSDHLDLDDSTKKYCSREMNEQTCVATPSGQTNNKRQREHLNGNMQFVESASPNTTNSTLTTQHSPEHLAKKRLCSYNNDITSSLSSSQIHASKRKFYDQTRNASQRSPMSSSPSGEEDDYRSTKKLQLQQPDQRSEQVTYNNNSTYKSFSPEEQQHYVDNVDNTAYAAATDTNASYAPRHDTSNVEVMAASTENKLVKKKKLTLFNKDYDESKVAGKANDHHRLALSSSYEKEDFSEIPFVKPKKTTSSTLTKNPIIERTQKSKLALMLKGLRGELYQSDGEDQVDEVKKTDERKDAVEQTNKAAEKPQFQANASGLQTSGNQIQLNAKTSVPSDPQTASIIKSSVANDATAKPVTTTTATSTLLKAAENSLTTTNNTQTQPTISLIPTSSVQKVDSNTTSNTFTLAADKSNKTKSPLVGLKLTPQTTTNTPNLFNTTTAATSDSSQLQNKPTLNFNANPMATTAASSTSGAGGGFSFNFTPAVATTTATATTEANKNLPPQINALTSSTNTFSLPTTNSFTLPTTNSFTLATTNSFTLPTTSSSTAVFGQTTQLGAQPAKPFTFGSLAASSANKSQSSGQSSQSGADKKIDFGQIGTSTATLPAATIKPLESSAANTSANLASSTAAAATTNGFSFGLKTPQMQKPSAVATPFTNNSSSALAQPAAPKALGTFTFGATTNAAAPSNVTTNSSGIAQQPNATKPLNAFTFGATANTTEPANSSIKSGQLTFGETATATNSFSFGGGGGTAGTNATFSFGSNLAAKPATQPDSSAAATKSTPFTFGASSTSLTANAASKGGGGGFSFGNTTPATATNKPEQPATNIFGSTNLAQQNTAASSPFSFGGSTGQPSNATPAATNSSSSIFGATPLGGAGAGAPNKTFTFGSSQNALTSPKSEAGGFSFNPVAKANTGGFSFTATKTDAAQQQQQPPPAFTFGALASKNTGPNESKPFQPQSAATATPNLFDNSTLLNKTASATPFSFTANAAANNSQNVQTNVTTPNLFAVAPQQNAGAANGEPRHFRRATRRLQKS